MRGLRLASFSSFVPLVFLLLLSRSAEAEETYCGIYAYTTADSCVRCPLHTRRLEIAATTSSVGDCVCEEGFHGGEPGKACWPCPTGAMCDGSKHPPRPREGFFRAVVSMASSPPDEAFLPCEPWWACSGTELGFNGTARCSGEGRTGFRCEAIKTSHRSFGKRLLECVPERHSLLGGRLLWTVGPSVIILGFWGLLGWAMMQTQAAYQDRGWGSPLHAIFASQMACIALRLPVRWPLSLEPLRSAASIILLDAEVWTPCGGWFRDAWTVGGIHVDEPLSIFSSSAPSSSQFGGLLRAQSLAFLLLVTVFPVMRVFLLGRPCRRSLKRDGNSDFEFFDGSDDAEQKDGGDIQMTDLGRSGPSALDAS